MNAIEPPPPEEKKYADMTSMGAMGLGYQIVLGGKDGYKIECVLPGRGWTDAFLKSKILEGCTHLRTLLNGKTIVLPMPKDQKELDAELAARKMREGA